MTKEAMIDAVRDHLDRNDWKYEYDPARDLIRSGVTVSNKFQSLKLYFVFKDNGYTMYATAPMRADEATRAMALEFISRANYGLRNGNFEMDMNDGEIRYKIFVNALGRDNFCDDLIEESIYLPISMYNRYGNGLVKVLMGFCDDVKAEIEAIENQ